MVFTNFSRGANDAITKAELIWKAALSDSILTVQIPMEKIYLDELHTKVDNVNKRLFSYFVLL